MADALSALVVLLLAWGAVQFVLVLVIGRQQSRLPRPASSCGGEDLTVIVLIACLDEAAVITGTVASIVEQPGVSVIVIDDGSDDDTGARALAAGGTQVTVSRRELPFARQGKGAALNHGYRQLRHDVEARGLDPARVIVVVMDADGRLSPGALPHVLDRFRDPLVGGVQLPVRIRNRGTLLTSLQDFEFWGVSALAQIARMRTHSVSLGGNGQFTRLAALLALGRDPWSDSLTEDLDLAVSLLVAGWRLTSTPHAHVSQQGVEHLGPLIRQRTRWFQGHMTCATRLPELWRSDALPGAPFVEVSAYLLGPLLLVLPWSILFTWGVAETFRRFATTAAVVGPLHGPLGRIAILVTWYLVSLAPNLAGALVYRRRTGASLVRCLALAHALIAFNYVTFLATWKAVARIARGQHGWAKTVRHVEAPVNPVNPINPINPVPSGAFDTA